MAKTVDKIKLADLLPASIASDSKVLPAAAALDGELHAVTEAIKETLIISYIDELPEAVIDLLAWQWHVDFYEPLGLSLKTKRALVKQSILWHRHKGTPSVIEEAVSMVYGEGNGRVREWFEYGGKPYHFKVEVINYTPENDTSLVSKAAELIKTVKNTRSWLEAIVLYYLPTISTISTVSAISAHKVHLTHGAKAIEREISIFLAQTAGCGYLKDWKQFKHQPISIIDFHRETVTNLNQITACHSTRDWKQFYHRPTRIQKDMPLKMTACGCIKTWKQFEHIPVRNCEIIT